MSVYASVRVLVCKCVFMHAGMCENETEQKKKKQFLKDGK